MPEWVMKTAARHLRSPAVVRVDRDTETPPEIQHVVYQVDPGVKFNALRTLLDQRGDGPVLVFGRTKHGVKRLARQLGELGYPVAALQGNLSQAARERVMADFRAGGLPILVATNVAARGLDVDGIERVINYEVPESAQLFTHRVGRTGRMGNQGESITFVTPEEGPKWRQIERALGRPLRRQAWPNGRATTSAGTWGATPPRPVAATTQASANASDGTNGRWTAPAARQGGAPARSYRFRTPVHRSSQRAAFGGGAKRS
jgi:superfamily II DNA/RNA helicase